VRAVITTAESDVRAARLTPDQAASRIVAAVDEA
jgi:hypothetical protein